MYVCGMCPQLAKKQERLGLCVWHLLRQRREDASRGGRAEDIFLGSQVGGVYYDATLRVRDLLSTQENWYQVRMRL